MSLPSSISGVVSISDVDSTKSAEDKQASGAPENAGITLFDSGDGDLQLIVNGTTLETHKYLIKRFSGLKDMIRNNGITLESNGAGVEDFRNTFKILYASIVEGPFHFDHLTLTSALRIATIYDYPALRSFSIKHLEKASLSAVERIRLAREFGLPLWEEPAYVELCNREEAMTGEEASVLGLDVFVHVARIREKEQRRRGKDIDAAMEPDDESEVGEVPVTKTSLAKGKKRKPKKVSPIAPESGTSEGKQDTAKGALTDTGKERAVGIIPKPSFIGVQTKGTRWRSWGDSTWVFDTPGCECGVNDPNMRCALAPCTASAIKHLQTQQLAHNANILKLEATIEGVQVALESLSNPQAHAEPDSQEPNQTESVQTEVRKWLAGVESGTVVA